MNSIILTGRMTDDAELKHSQSGVAVATFSIAVDRGKDRDGKDKGTDFPRCIAFGKTAENLAKYQGKGSKILIDGHLQTGSYTKQDGTKVYTTDVIADKVEFLESKKQQTPESLGFHEYGEDDEGDLPF